MKRDRLTRHLAVFLLFLAWPAQNSILMAAPLGPFSDQRQNVSEAPHVTKAEPRLVPVSYSTNVPGGDFDSYLTQQNEFAPYTSFLQAPQYGLPAYPGTSPVLPSANDPLRASEVSPYAHYSPYTEIVGEGSDYTLGIDDVVTIIVRNQPEFSGRYVVDPEGNIQYGFVGDIPAEGMTKGELKSELIQRLKRFVRYPEVAVMITQYRSKFIYVFGFVNAPGRYAMKGNKITVKEAIVAAGLPRTDGALKRVYVVRPSEFTGDGKSKKKKVNLKKLLQKGDSSEDFLLEPGDTIVVHQKYFDKFVNAYNRIVGPIFQTAALYEFGFGDIEGGVLD